MVGAGQRRLRRIFPCVGVIQLVCLALVELDAPTQPAVALGGGGVHCEGDAALQGFSQISAGISALLHRSAGKRRVVSVNGRGAVVLVAISAGVANPLARGRGRWRWRRRRHRG